MSQLASSTDSALRTIKTELTGLQALYEALNGPLGVKVADAIEVLRQIKGRVIVTGVGKSGHVGGKIAATFASTGTPAQFVHPAEANHGDLGMITSNDAILGISWSGETEELKGILTYSRRFSIPLIAICRNPDSALGKMSDICLVLPKEKEACPHGLAPTTSALMQLAIGDALAVALLEEKGFSADDFGIYHPGGSLGASLTHMGEIMHTGDAIPIVSADAAMREVVQQISSKSFGCVCVTDGKGDLAGIITDGDLRRHMEGAIMDLAAQDIMTRNPVTVTADMLAGSAMAILNEKPITALIVVEERKPVGIVHLHDLLRIGVA